MYNFNLMDKEEIIEIFDNILIKQKENKKITTIALTNKRLLFLDYIALNEGAEALRIANGVDYIKYKEVYYQIDLNDIKSKTKEEYYIVTLKDNTTFEFDNDKLSNLLDSKL